MESPLDEETPLLTKNKIKPLERTPLPKFQIAILLLLQLSEPISSSSILPYINQLIIELGITGGDQRKVGYYAGLIESLFFATEALTVLQWGRISDQVGRKPVLLLGLAGSALSMICFGLSRTFWTLVISRCLCGLLNGNIGVMKSAVGELTDATNRPEGLAFLAITWSVGATIAPMLGGSLSRPYERFPTVFTSEFWREYPYSLPCFVAAIFTSFSFLIALFFFKETLPNYRNHSISPPSSGTITPNTNKPEPPLPIRKLLTYPVVISVSNYVSLAFMDIGFFVLLPLFMSTPVEFGGLGFSPATIGYVLGAQGAYIGIFQLLFFSRLVRRFGERSVFMAGIFTFTINSFLFPLISFTARYTGVTWVVWSLLAFALSLWGIMAMCFGCIMIYIMASSPSKNSLGATNGLAQMTVSVTRALGPWLATSLFAVSLEKNLLGGYGVYAVLFIFSCMSLYLGSYLPRKMWDECD